MADEVKKGAEQASAQEEVKKTGSEASTEKEQLSNEDIAALAKALKDSLEREAKTAEERDNYKEGMLKAKGKLKSDDAEVKEDADTSGSSAELAEIVKAVLKQNQEIVTAVVNKSQIATAGQGGSSEAKAEVGDNELSAAQLQHFKSLGWDDKKIALLKSNFKKAGIYK